MANDISFLPWRVKFEGSTVAALPTIEDAATFVHGWKDDLTQITIHFELELI